MSECNEILRLSNLPMPRTCRVCGLGPCKRANPAACASSLSTKIEPLSALSNEELLGCYNNPYTEQPYLGQFHEEILRRMGERVTEDEAREAFEQWFFAHKDTTPTRYECWLAALRLAGKIEDKQS